MQRGAKADVITQQQFLMRMGIFARVEQLVEKEDTTEDQVRPRAYVYMSRPRIH
jgi:SAM-dependent MidA family methyltransferase